MRILGRIMEAGRKMRIVLRTLAILVLARPGAARAAEDVPFVTTPDNVTAAMLEMANVGKRDFVIDLGTGDGRIVITAASRFGASGLGVELIPDLVRQSRENAKRAGVEARTEFREQDLFETELRKATVVTLYLLPEVNLQLRPKLLALKPGTRIVSHDWDMGDWKPDQERKLAVPAKKVGVEKSSRVYLWIVPLQVGGAWCGTGAARGATLELRQQFQEFHGELAVDGGAPKAFEGRVEGSALRITQAADDRFELMLSRKRLVLRFGGNPFASQRAIAFVRCK